MIKKIANRLFNEFNPNASSEEKKWINVFNEIEHRIDVLFESLVSWYTVNIFFQHLRVQNISENYVLYPLRHKAFIYESYMFIELNNLLDIKGDSSITGFVNHFYKDVSDKGKEFISIFQTNIDLNKLKNHFDLFMEWREKNSIEINHFKYMRDKNYSHVDHNFEYDNKVSFEYLIQAIVFLSDYTSILANIMKMMKIRIMDGEPVAIQKEVFLTTSIDVIRIRFKQEINALSKIYNFEKKSKENMVLNCWDSIEETLKNVKLIKLMTDNNNKN
ncbi:hypothetical protein [Acholeplasma laidlawii]|uniref:Uncharacterized protein n=4 Tax=Acholeplasma laidlawii TaxID=2148 RepID=A9NHN4_ACHLI|nr:hypothetical protein [Acholeplasma laidlawii]ABX81864.1 hypothetical protein ACL_1265 [Acholeplasma laidlawii PG-8A]NWH10850.1 hypothetical protein [Acholeplasma laidlawii]NWH12235.1 hypothetical protein [Acholeplasma laidlawii]NWH13621.1 hypothetical protein [Acholeplasma laidlawii]NWH14212.1 hypothetical protein [Acholeplasma laidlawii]